MAATKSFHAVATTLIDSGNHVTPLARVIFQFGKILGHLLDN
jgi:hypothetical protein